MIASTVELKDLTVFMAVSDAAGFRRAASQLGVRPSMVSQRVRNLEERLGVSLFQRSQDGVRLTHSGAALRADLNPILAQLDLALSRACESGRGKRGLLKVGIVVSISSSSMNDLIRSCREAHPDVTLEFLDGSPQSHLAGIQNRAIDVAMVTGSPLVPGCDVEKMFCESVLVAVASDHALARESAASWGDLISSTFIVSQDAPGPDFHDYIIRHLSDNGSSPRFYRHAVGRETLLVMVGLGMGVTFVSAAEAGVRYPNVCFIPLEGAEVPFSAVWHPGNDNPALRRFLSAARILRRQRSGSGDAPSQTPGRSP